MKFKEIKIVFTWCLYRRFIGLIHSNVHFSGRQDLMGTIVVGMVVVGVVIIAMGVSVVMVVVTIATGVSVVMVLVMVEMAVVVEMVMAVMVL